MYEFINETKQNRLFVLNAIVKKLKFNQIVSSSNNLKVTVKQFYKGENILNDCASIFKTIDELDYETDGLIFTPTNYGVGVEDIEDEPINKKKTWLRSFKWKPPEFNTIDFFVTTKKDVSGVDDIKNIFEDGISMTSQNIKEYKTLVLRVGYDENKHGFINPCSDLQEGNFPKYNQYNDVNKYKPMPFIPTRYTPNFPIYECRLVLDTSGTTKQMLTENGDEIIEDNTIVEFRYDPTRDKYYQWIPIRVRYDKTAEFRKGLKNYGNAFNWRKT